MDFVWVCRRGDNEELRYSIRSVLASFPDANIWVVGGKPDWYGGNFIKTNRIANKYSQVEENLEKIVMSKNISETFVLMNDDFFIVKPVTKIEYFYKGDLDWAYQKLKEKFPTGNFYADRLYKMARRISAEFGIDKPLNYEMHIPMVMEKRKLSTILGKRYPMWRSVYGNKYSVGGTQVQDVKVYASPEYLSMSFDYTNTDCPYLSTDDDSFKDLQSYLHGLFPNPSKYELDK